MQFNIVTTNPFNYSSIFAILFEDAQYVHYTLPVVHRRKSHADVVELVDTLALGASAARREGSSPFIRTIRRLTKRKHSRKRLSPDKGGGSFFISRF